ncbi:hypothetical protein PAXINDRAFT_9140 [Paxillus involutus ATCC 200175]|nr:hypothetical protein PAXINDRAFT_9140 [Paxillus involutus ATCC 200175]
MSTPMIVALVVPVAVLLANEGLRKLRRPSKSSGPPLPPGPTPIPFLRNVWGLNADAPYLTYAEWSKTYMEIIVLNSEEVAVELLEKRSNKYSDRPLFTLADLYSDTGLVANGLPFSLTMDRGSDSIEGSTINSSV